MPVEPNLEAINPAPVGAAGTPPITPRAINYDPTQDRETVRGLIAIRLLWALIGVIAITILTAIVTTIGCSHSGACQPDLMELKPLRVVIELVLTPLIGLVGAVTGFYFGEKSGSAKASD